MAGVGERLSWCAATRPEPVRIRGRNVSGAIQKAVLWSLVNYSGADGTSFPRQSRLADEACLSRPTVNAALLALEENGLIAIDESPDRRHRTYVLNLSSSPTDLGAAASAESVRDADLGVRDANPGLSSSPTRSVRDANYIEEPPRNRPLEPPKEPAPPASPSASQPDVFEAVLDACELRAARLTERHRNEIGGIARQLRMAGFTPEEIRAGGEAYRRHFGAVPTPGALHQQLPRLVDAGLGAAIGARGSDEDAVAELRRRREEAKAG